MEFGQAATMEPIAQEDQLRAHAYALLGRVLSAPPSEATLALLRGLSGDATELGRAFHALSSVARATNVTAASEEFHDLFIGLAQGELQPYASVYLTGFLQDRPLAELRGDLLRLGARRRESVFEPEDHIASLCEIMAGLITGVFGAPSTLAQQRAFFERHLASWAGRFFGDLEAAKAAKLYMPIGTIGRLFMAIERDAFALS